MFCIHPFYSGFSAYRVVFVSVWRRFLILQEQFCAMLSLCVHCTPFYSTLFTLQRMWILGGYGCLFLINSLFKIPDAIYFRLITWRWFDFSTVRFLRNMYATWRVKCAHYKYANANQNPFFLSSLIKRNVAIVRGTIYIHESLRCEKNVVHCVGSKNVSNICNSSIIISSYMFKFAFLLCLFTLIVCPFNLHIEKRLS